MRTFKNTAFTTRNYECTNIVAATGEAAPTHSPTGYEYPAGQWIECDADTLAPLDMISSGNGVTFYGYL